MSTPRIDRVITSGIIGKGSARLQLENNVWLLGDTQSVIIIDAGHDAEAIIQAVGGRETLAILLTHGHPDHINRAVDLSRTLECRSYLHPADLFLWQATYPDTHPECEITDGQRFQVAGVDIITAHTPGHTPGSVSFTVPALNTVFSGDTLFQGGPGATRWDYSDFPQIVDSIRTRLLTLKSDTEVRPGHGANTRVDVETAQLQNWLTRGW